MKLLVALAILAAPVAIYVLVIRPRLASHLPAAYEHLDGFWSRVAARLSAFRSLVVFSLGSVLAALPGILESLRVMDLSALPQPWPGYVGMGTSVALVLIRAFATTPAGQASSGEA